MKKDNTKKQFLNLIKPDIFDHIAISHNWDKMHSEGLDRDFLVDGNSATFIQFVCDLVDRHAQAKDQNSPLIFRNTPSPTSKFVGVLPTEVTAVFDDKGFPQGYIETLDRDYNKKDEYSRYFGLLDNHSFFYEDAALHNGKRVCTYVNLRHQDVFKFTESHEAYRRIIFPAIAKIEKSLADNCISHAPISEDSQNQM